MINFLKSPLKSGDIIFRNGTDEVRKALRSFNCKDIPYSPCGLVFIVNDTSLDNHASDGSFNLS